MESSVRIPRELAGAAQQVLEEYVRARIVQFANAFSGRVSPALAPGMVQRATAETIQSLPPPEPPAASLETRDLQLVFRHDCLSLGCLDPQCPLCEHNPHRRCNVNFAPKYLVNDLLKAKCDATIRVEIIDRLTGLPLNEDIPDVHLEMCILDGNSYDAKCLEAGSERDEDLDACTLLVNNKGSPLLVSGSGGTHNAQSKVVVNLSRGMAQLPDLHVSDSSEALLSGRKPPFRLLVRAVNSEGGSVTIRHAVSEGYVVATRRTRTAGKVEIPNVDDHVSKLEHMGKETVKKLQDLTTAARQCGIDISVPDNCINKVGEFRKLSMLAEADGHLRQKLQQLLKLSKEKWDDARDHAMRAVVADNRMRIWYADKATMEVGLLFTCRLGNIDLERPVGLLQKKSQEGRQTTLEATLMAEQSPAQREQVRQLQQQGAASWWQQGHPGWAIYPVDSEQFLVTGALEAVHVPAPEPVLPAPAPLAGAGAAVPRAPAGTPPGMQGLQPTAFGTVAPGAAYTAPGPMPGMGALPAALQALTPDMAAMMQQCMGHPAAVQAAMRPPAAPGMRPPGTAPINMSAAAAAAAAAAANGTSSPFAALAGASKQQQTPSAGPAAPGAAMPPASGGGVQQPGGAMLGGQLPLNMFSNFPSLPMALQSGDLDALFTGHSLMNLPSFAQSMGIQKLESMEMPDANAAVAMLHDIDKAQGNGAGGAGGHGGGADAAAAPAGGPPGHPGAGPGALPRMGSGLESMQSIEQALGNVDPVHQVIDSVAEGWQARQAGGAS